MVRWMETLDIVTFFLDMLICIYDITFTVYRYIVIASETCVKRNQREMASMFCHKGDELFNIRMLIQENIRYTPRVYHLCP